MLAQALPESGLQQRFVHGVWLILATGARVSELIGAVWAACPRTTDELRAVAEDRDVKMGVVDMERHTWHLTQTKNQRDHTIHLSAFALKQFKALAALRDAYWHARGQAVPWVFPNLAGDGPVGVKSLGKQLSDRQRKPDRRLEGRTKASSALVLPRGRWTAHDLRRTAATLMAGAGVSGDVIDECLNHIIESRVRRIYIRDRREAAQARAFELLGAILEDLVNASGVESRSTQGSSSWRDEHSSSIA
jgi:integrase